MSSTPAPLIQPLHEGPLDLIGDVHGEWDCLDQLREALGYDAGGRHPDGRQLVFVGDLGDRGHDSPAVIHWVRQLVQSGRAQCVLGNHELNVLRGEERAENAWLRDHHGPPRSGAYRSCRHATAAERDAFVAFFDTLPLALHRADLRVVHAEWNSAAVEHLRDFGGTAREAFDHFEDQARHELQQNGTAQRAADELARYAALLGHADAHVPLLAHVARQDCHFQQHNPVRVLTSGHEEPAEQPFFSSGKWRMARRVDWWLGYDEATPVVVGHYWRMHRGVRARGSHGSPFDKYSHDAWVGRRGNVFCVDYSVGNRYRGREGAAVDNEGRLGALRWPERELVFAGGG